MLHKIKAQVLIITIMEYILVMIYTFLMPVMGNITMGHIYLAM